MKAALCTTVIAVCVVLAIAPKPSELYGRVTNRNQSPASGVVLSIGNYSVTTDKTGNYRMTFLAPGFQMISITPPGKPTHSVRIKIGTTPTRQDFVVDW